jgi:hypothetical protein
MSKTTLCWRTAALPKTRREDADRVVTIGEQIAAAIAALDKLESAKPHPETYERDWGAPYDYMSALEAMAMSQPATSLAGCMLQVALMNHLFDSCNPAPSLSTYSNDEAARRFEVAAYSVIDILLRETGRDPKTLGCDCYAGARLSRQAQAAHGAAERACRRQGEGLTIAKSTTRRAEPRKEPWPNGELSFMQLRAKPKVSKAGRLGPHDFWVVEETGDWVADNKIGEDFARELLEAMQASRDPTLLGLCVADMIEHGRFGGVECGFLFAFSSWAVQARPLPAAGAVRLARIIAACLLLRAARGSSDPAGRSSPAVSAYQPRYPCLLRAVSGRVESVGIPKVGKI